MVLFGSMNYPKLDPLGELDRIAKQGFDFVDFTTETKSRVEYLDVKIVRNKIEDLGLKVVGSTDWRLHTGSPYPAIRKEACNEILKEIEFLAEIGAKYTTVHFDTHSSGFERELSMKRIIESFHIFAENAKEIGVTVVVENGDGTEEHINEIGLLMHEVPSVFFHIDVGHAHINGGNEGINEFIERYKDRIKHIHFSDNLGAYDEHLGMGYGDVDWERTVKLLKKIGYDSTITLETFNPKDKKDVLLDSFSKAKKIWREGI
jgi:sugar phosphate isomerase/epimerase